MKGPTNSSARPNIRLMDQSITFSANDDDGTNIAFPYRASVEDDRINHYMSATIIFDSIQAASGNYATFCQTYDGGVYIYAKIDPGTITIPAVSCDIAVSYADMDDTPTRGSNIPITSDGVYDALEDYATLNVLEDYVTLDAVTNNNIATAYTPPTGFQNWLHVSLSDKDSPYNKTVKLDSTYANVPQESGDSVYCTIGIRYVDWVSSGFVGVHVYGWGNDSKFHHWINGYNSNTGTWRGWKRIDQAPLSTTIAANGMTIQKVRYGNEIIYTCIDKYPTSTGVHTIEDVALDCAYRSFNVIWTSTNGTFNGYVYVETGTNKPKMYIATAGQLSHFELRVLLN